MTSEELEREIKRLEEQIEDQINILRSKFLESEANKKLYEVKVPEDIENYYYVDETGRIDSLCVYVEDAQKEVYKRGLAFETREEVEQYDKERILLFKLHKWAEEHNEGWFPDWQKGRPKYFAMFNRLTGDFSVGADCYCGVFTKLPYLKSDELAEQFIEEFGEEIKEVLL